MNFLCIVYSLMIKGKKAKFAESVSLIIMSIKMMTINIIVLTTTSSRTRRRRKRRRTRTTYTDENGQRTFRRDDGDSEIT